VDIPAAVTTIGAAAFYRCDLRSVTIPKNVTSIGLGAFRSYMLPAINVDPANQLYSSQDGVLFNKDKTVLIAYPHYKNHTTYQPNETKLYFNQCNTAPGLYNLLTKEIHQCNGSTTQYKTNQIQIDYRF
jgi:hypothetical protein